VGRRGIKLSKDDGGVYTGHCIEELLAVLLKSFFQKEQDREHVVVWLDRCEVIQYVYESVEIHTETECILYIIQSELNILFYKVKAILKQYFVRLSISFPNTYTRRMHASIVFLFYLTISSQSVINASVQ
jgi:hypothetical protein